MATKIHLGYDGRGLLGRDHDEGRPSARVTTPWIHTTPDSPVERSLLT
ncbi:hypothetical protein [Streptomyces sp. NPDC058989]